VQGDIVTLVPPRAWGYRHVGSLDKLGPWRLPCVEAHKPDWYKLYLAMRSLTADDFGL
jgi:hypothetical protein